MGAMINRYVLSGLAFAGLLQPAGAYDVRARLDLEPLIVKHAAANNVPAALVHRIIIRESRYNPRAVGRGGAMGLMQIKHGTARALGYTGTAAGLLDADTNLTYAVRYLAGAYRVANGDQNQAVGFYARGYYYDAKRRGMLGTLARRPAVAEEPAVVTAAAPQPQQTPSLFSIFAPPPPAEPAAAQAVVVAEEPEAAPVATRRGRPPKRGAVAVPTIAAVQPGAAVELVQTAAVPLPPKRQDRPAQRRTSVAAPVQAPVMAGVSAQDGAVVAGEGSETQAAPKRRGRSAGRTTASGANRSAQKASGQPDDPGRTP
jgi:hypothetical protein